MQQRGTYPVGEGASPNMKARGPLGGLDIIKIALGVAVLIFLILSIVFIVLFATKHESSSAFLVTGITTKTRDEVSNELQGMLKKKWTVNSFGVDVQNGQASAVFSLRDYVSVNDVQSTLVSSTTVLLLQTTYGDQASSVCHPVQPVTQPVQTAAPTVASTAAPTVASTAAPTVAPTSAPTVAPTTPVPLPDTLYCEKNDVKRDVLIILDMNTNKKVDNADKVKQLGVVRDQLSKGLPASTNVFIAAYAGTKVVEISTAFTGANQQIINDFNKAIQVAGAVDSVSFDLPAVLQYGSQKFPNRKATPSQIVILTDKASGTAPSYNPRDKGIYVAVALAGAKSTSFDSFVDQVKPYTSWADLAEDDVFADTTCRFYVPPQKPNANLAQLSQFPLSSELAVHSTPSCEIIDVFIAFDTSESLSRIILPKYVDFAKNFVNQYTFGNEATRIGIISFTTDVEEVLSMTNGVTSVAVNAAIDQVKYTGGQTDITNMLVKVKGLFTAEQLADKSRGKVLLVLSDAVPTVNDDTNAEIAAGQDLARNGVAVFFVGYQSYDANTRNVLNHVTNPDYVFDNMADAATLTSLTNEIIVVYPCPIPRCVTAYFAVEVSEATDAIVFEFLKSVIQIVQQAATMQTDAVSYQLITYNEDKTRFNPPDAKSSTDFIKYIQSLIDNPTMLTPMDGGHTDLDKSIDDITTALNRQIAKNNRFTSNIVFFGQANIAVLEPDVPEATKKQQLANAAGRLQAITGLIYVVDSSKDPILFGDDLWGSVTKNKNIVPVSNDVIAALKTTDYFQTWSKLSCELPPIAKCHDTPLDVAIIFDLTKKDDALMAYVQRFVSQFDSYDDTHFSMMAYGAQQTKVLEPLQAYTASDLKNATITYEMWRNGTMFITTTMAPTTKQAQANFEVDIINPLQDYVVNAGSIQSLFSSITTQYGCGHYSDLQDRLFAPNVFVIFSDNFGTYTQSVWDEFNTQCRNLYGCRDCAGTPSFVFVSRTDFVIPVVIKNSRTLVLTDTDLHLDSTDKLATQISVNKFNSLVNGVCGTGLQYCTSYSCYTE